VTKLTFVKYKRILFPLWATIFLFRHCILL